MPMRSSSPRRAVPVSLCFPKPGRRVRRRAGWRTRKTRPISSAASIIGVKDPYLARTLLDLSQTATLNDSLKLGKDVLGELGRINTLHKGQVEQAGFAVLKAPDIPSILVETAFISNPEEEKRLNDEDYQDKMAEAILRGIKRYFAKNPRLAVAKSKLRRAGPASLDIIRPLFAIRQPCASFSGSLEQATTSTVLTIGNFDGLHLGHRAMLERLTRRRVPWACRLRY